MTDSNDNDRKTDGSRAGGGTLTIKRPSIEQSRVKQSFAHGRSKTVVVETKRKRFDDGKPAQSPEPRAAFQPSDGAGEQPRMMLLERGAFLARQKNQLRHVFRDLKCKKPRLPCGNRGPMKLKKLRRPVPCDCGRGTRRRR